MNILKLATDQNHEEIPKLYTRKIIMKKATFLLLTFLLPYTLAAETGLHNAIGRDYGYLESLYHHLHLNPEISFQEEKTSKRLAQELREAGFEVTENVGGYGIVGILRNGAGPVVLLRTDMDALPVKEMTGLPYASEVKTIDDQGNEVNTMHACGHDIHMSVFVGTARRLSDMRNQWRGTVVMIGQPAEERGAGARAMLGDGLFSRFPRPDYNLGLHVNAEIPAGKIGYVSGFAMANVDSVDITVYGVGGHGAYPNTARDPIVLSAQIINSLQTLVSRVIPPIEAGVVTVGSIHGGTKHNIIPDEVRMQLTVRSYTDEVRDELLNGIKRIAMAQATVMDLPEGKMPLVEIKDEHTPALYNDPELTASMVSLLKNRFGDDRIIPTSPVMGGEDFAEYGRVEPRIPGLFLWLGAVTPDEYEKSKTSGTTLPSLHSPFFAPLPEPTITTGVEVMTTMALELLGN